MEKKSKIIYWGYLTYKKWTFCIAITDKGLCRILQPQESFSVLESWVAKHFPQATLIYDQYKLTPYLAQFQEYFQGQRKTFNLPLDLRGTDFQMSVWRALQEIPYGTTKSYLEIAQLVNKPAAVRAVGAANGANPIPIVVPCHRVIGKNGLLTGYRGGLEIKEELLKIEGITDIAVPQKNVFCR
ncbi:MAG: methylated-DNA-[protein]-cysteine S-methyltransferase [Clostridia bacterium]|jgi:methylated-DNA-[protein]-cysteine S-methyltransferase|nr:methylated-DNA-[protein]-cysteine S-methyltransferase [Clostridia bacterium]MDN5321875.1 methylated-DNA-[protein]-cysteine S-methyltransferase [Clostridia bacterium]